MWLSAPARRPGRLRAGVRGFRIFLACLALGVAAIAAAGSTAEAFRHGLASQAREILGGDLAVSASSASFTPAERAAFDRTGAVSYAASVEAMAQAPSGERRLVELRGVSDAYPLAGKVELAGGGSLAEALRPEGDAAGAAVEQPTAGPAGSQARRPVPGRQRAGGGAGGAGRRAGPAVARLRPGPPGADAARGGRGGGFLDPGLPFGETARIALPPASALAPARAAARRPQARRPAGGCACATATTPRPGLRRLIDQLEYFLGFIGLASLVAGGLGVSGAVSAYLEARKPSIAVLKALGADGAAGPQHLPDPDRLLACLGVAIGLVDRARRRRCCWASW